MTPNLELIKGCGYDSALGNHIGSSRSAWVSLFPMFVGRICKLRLKKNIDSDMKFILIY